MSSSSFRVCCWGLLCTLLLCVLVCLENSSMVMGASPKNVPLVFPDRFVVNFDVTNRDDGEHRFAGTATVSKKDDGQSHIRLSSNTIIKEVVSLLGSPENRKHVEKTKKYYFDSNMYAFREVVHIEGASPSSRLIPTSPFEFHKLIDIVENENYLIPDDMPVFDVAVNKLCPASNSLRLLVFFEHQHYVLCLQKSSLKSIPIITHIINSNFIVNIQRFIPVTDESQLMTLSSEEEQFFPSSPLKFSKHDQEKVYLSKTRSIPEKAYLFDSKYSCSLSWLRDDVVCGSLKRGDVTARPNRTCIFLHGVGQWPSQAGPPVNDFPDYWGKVSSYTPQCTERWFIREETKYRGWNNSELQHSYCSLSLWNTTGTVIRDKILFTHSMGTMILAAGIQNGICSIDKETVSWYDVMGPIRGSKASLFLKEICVRANTWTDPSIYKIVADEGGYCIGGNSTNVYPAYGTLAPNFPGIQDLVNYTAPYVTGQMCGSSAYGLNSIYAVPLFLLSELVGYGQPNDGMVPVPSCQISPNNTLGPTFADLYYEVSANHADGTCRDGDAWWGNSKPCSYYTNKV